jgi:hypothetical protein
MGRIRKHAAVLVIAVFIVLCAVSAGIAIRVTVTMIEKRNQVIDEAAKPEEEKQIPAGSVVKPGKLKDQTLYFNGAGVEDMSVFASDKKQVFIPLDLMLNRIGTSFRFYGSDDLLEAEPDKKKLLVRLGIRNFRLGEEEILLPEAPFTAKEHILVPLELLSNIGGFTTDAYPDKETVFVNYHPGITVEKDLKMKIFRFVEGKLEVTDIGREKSFLKRTGTGKAGETLEFSEDRSVAVLKSQGKVYILRNKGSVSKQEVGVDPAARLSRDGRHLYWVDEEQKTAFVYDIATRITRKPGSSFYRILSSHGKGSYFAESSTLLTYREGKGYKRAVLGNTLSDAGYTFLERHGKVIVEGNASYSPDRKRILFLKKDKGYCLVNSDGTGLISLGKLEQAQWLNNTKVLASDGNGRRIYNRRSRKWTKTATGGALVGQAADGAVFFTLGSDLYYEKGGKEKKIVTFPGECIGIYAKMAGGPYIAASAKEDGLFFIEGGQSKPSGSKYSLLLKGMKKGEMFVDMEASVSASPNNLNFVVLQREDGFIALHVLGKQKAQPRKIVLNYRTDDTSQLERVRMQWVSDTRILVFTDDRGWIIDLAKSIRIREWLEGKDSRIVEILP